MSASRVELDRWWVNRWSYKRNGDGDTSRNAASAITGSKETIALSRELLSKHNQLVMELREGSQEYY